MLSSPICVLGLLLLSLQPAQCFYNPSTGRWLSRDPIEEEAGPDLYAFVDNRSVGGWDILGRIEFQGNSCQGCNGPAVTQVTANTCPGDAQGTYGAINGNGAGFHTSCNQPSGLMCDTETHAKLRFRIGKVCCKSQIWQIRCNFDYDGTVTGDTLTRILVRWSFLGASDSSVRQGPDPNVLSVHKSYTKHMRITSDTWIEVATMVAEDGSAGTTFHKIDEAGRITCSVKCEDPRFGM
jgi:hypothetical protein